MVARTKAAWAGIISCVAAALCAAGTAGATVIDTTPGLLYHLDAAAGVVRDANNNVSAWNDQSPNGNNFAQATATKQPTFVASSTDFNNLPVVHFNGDLTGAGTTAPNASRLVLANSTTPVTVFIVNRTTSSNGLDGIWGRDEGDYGIRRQSTTTWQTRATGDGNDFATSMFVNGTSTNVQPVGTAAVLTAVGDGTQTLAQTGLGEYFDCCGAGARPWGGDIAEVAVYSGVLSASDRQAIEGYLGQKYFNTPEPASLGLFGLGAAGLLARRRRSA